MISQQLAYEAPRRCVSARRVRAYKMELAKQKAQFGAEREIMRRFDCMLFALLAIPVLLASTVLAQNKWWSAIHSHRPRNIWRCREYRQCHQ
jgi:hypothetical protein